MNVKRRLPATMEDVSRFSADLESHLSELTVEARTRVVLAMQELLVNIVRHAYAGAEGHIDVLVTQRDTTMEVIVTDHAATTFTMPREVAAPDPFSLPESGLGLFIIQQAFDTVHHEALAAGNRWTLTKTLGA